MDPHELLGRLAADPATRAQLVHVEDLPAREAHYARGFETLPGALRERLTDTGVTALYSHQAHALRELRAGADVVVATGTASGKSLVYLIPILDAILAEPRSTALLVYPTKALAQDQLRAVRELRLPGVIAMTYDGDTPEADRRWARSHANLILTNPDMLHIGILPQHRAWGDFLHRLGYIVADELHTLRGVFGSHVGHILRRLRRLAAHYRAEPRGVFASATVGNPQELATEVWGGPVAAILEDGSPHGHRRFALWNPPLVEPDGSRRRSSNSETATLLAAAVAADLQAIAFNRSRRSTELVARAARRELMSSDPARAAQVRPYRGGYLAEERREIEKALFAGELAGVAATEALELGIDVGGLDVAILNGFPGSIASIWQQAGRAGRRRGKSAAIYVAGPDAIDQWFMAHPHDLFTRAPEAAVVNMHNPQIALSHLRCAAAELGVDSDDPYLVDVQDNAVVLVAAGDCRIRAGKLVRAGMASPHREITIRAAGGDTVHIVDAATDNLLGTVEEARAPSQVHPGAVYLHQGENYLVAELDLVRHVALVEAATPDHYTQPREDIDIDVVRIDEKRALGRKQARRVAEVAHGAVRVTRQVTAYQRKAIATGEVLEVEELDLPPYTYSTQAVLLRIPIDALAAAGLVEPMAALGALHAAEHTAIGMIPLFAIADRWDVGGLSTPFHPATSGPAIFIYDGYPGGAGLAPLVYGRAEEVLAAAAEVLRTCACANGCPSCVQSPKCGNWNEPLDRFGALRLLDVLLAHTRG